MLELFFLYVLVALIALNFFSAAIMFVIMLVDGFIKILK